MKKSLKLTKQTKAMLVRFSRALARDNRRLREQLYGVADTTIPYTADAPIKRGETVIVHVPRKFLTYGD